MFRPMIQAPMLVPSQRREADISATRYREGVMTWVRPKRARLRLDPELYELAQSSATPRRLEMPVVRHNVQP
jgi:hypothetical protein